MRVWPTVIFISALALVVFFKTPTAIAQDVPDLTAAEGPSTDETEAEEIIPTLPQPGGELKGEEGPAIEQEIKKGEAGEGETRWNVRINGAVIMNYVFNNSPDNFVVKYRWEVKGEANAKTAVINGDADINATVDGPFFKWPTGECRLEITIPKVPFELTFKKSEDEKGSIKLVFKRQINEDWQSRCTFVDAPSSHFDTHGPPEMWLTKALERARPPLKDIIASIGTEETTTTFVISKEEIDDPPLGTIEIEGTGVVTIHPGGE